MSEGVSKVSLQRIRLAVFAFYFCQGLVFSSWASRIPDIKSFMGMNDANWGTMLLMISVGQMCGMTISGFLVSQFGSKKILLAMLPCYTLILLPIALVSNEYGMIIVLLLYGIFANFMNISINTQGVNVETLYDKQIMSSFHGGWSLAGFVGSLIGLLMINIGFSPLYHFSIIVCIVMIILVANFKYLPFDIKKESPSIEGTRKRKKPEKFLFVLGIVAFCGMLIEGTMFDWSGVYFENIVKAPHSLVPLGFAGFMVMMASGRFFADRAISRWGRRLVIQVCGILAGIGLLIAVVLPNIVVTTIAFMIVGLGVSSIVPTIYSVAGQKTKISTGLALTVVSSISFLGFLLGPPIIGYISNATNLRYSFTFAGLFAILIIILVSRINIFKEDAASK
jgi:MFS family permease